MSSVDSRTRAKTVGSLGALVSPIHAVFASRQAPPRTSADSSNSSPMTLRKTRSERSLSGSTATGMSLEDYASLSSSIKKKYFSSAERLHLAQRTATQKRRKQSVDNTSWMSSSTSNIPAVRPVTSGGISLRRRQSSHQDREARPKLAESDADNISQDQARWYLGLPDKIRKQHFTRHEQLSLAAQCKRVLDDTAPDFADEALHHCLNGTRDDEFFQVPKKQRPMSSATVDTDILIIEGDMEADPYDTVATPASLRPVMDMLNLYLRPDLHETNEPTSIPPPPDSVSEPITNSRLPRRTSFSRALGFAPIALPPPQLSPIPPVPPLPATLLKQYNATASGTNLADGGEAAAGAQEQSSDSRPYQQPDVRKQLRNYLSPEKFDEAIEFGFSFPANDDAPSSSATEQSFPPQPPPLYHTDDDAEEDGSDSLETNGPRTPTTFTDNHYTTMKQRSFDSSLEGSVRHNFFTTVKTPPKSRSPGGSIGNREMTIHMTLTRRDLLDVERVDPLALEAIPICDDPTGAHGAFAVGNNRTPRGFKKMWKSILGH